MTITTDFETIKKNQRAAWETGNYTRVGNTLQIMAERLVEAADVRAGQRVLDVACGQGNVAIAATLRFASATGVDYATNLLAQGRERAASEHLDVTFLEGDAEQLPFADGAFDVATGAFVINHLPDPERAVAELRRVARRVSLAMWAEDTPLFALPTRAAGAAPVAGPDAERFASRENLLALLPGEVTEITFDLELDDFDALWDGLLGGTVRTAARLAEAHREPLRALAEPYRHENGYALPTTVRVVTACCRRPAT
jgi:SAM-dependent methyltransferase